MTYDRFSADGAARRRSGGFRRDRVAVARRAGAARPRSPAADPRGPTRVMHQRDRPRRCQHEAQPLGRVRRVQRHVRARPPSARASMRGDQLRRALQADAHAHLRPHAAPPQRVAPAGSHARPAPRTSAARPARRARRPPASAPPARSNRSWTHDAGRVRRAVAVPLLQHPGALALRQSASRSTGRRSSAAISSSTRRR